MDNLKTEIKKTLENLLLLPSFQFKEPLNIYEKESLVIIVELAKSNHYINSPEDKVRDRDYLRSLKNSEDERLRQIYKLLSRLLKESSAYSKLTK